MRLRLGLFAAAVFMLLIKAAPLPAVDAKSFFDSLPDQKFISEVDFPSCRAQGSKWSTSRVVIPGNGRLCQLGVRAPAHTSRFIGAYIRVGLDTRYLSTCPVDFPLQPVLPTKGPPPASYLHQRCHDEAQGMSKDGCIVDSVTIACLFTNPSGAHAEYLAMSACWQ
jgi:hypothetical protein